MSATPSNQYLFLITGSPCQQGHLSPEQMQTHMTESTVWMNDLFQRGVISAAQPLMAERRYVAEENGAISDGVYAESKEAVGGYFIINADSMEEAVRIARGNPSLKFGTRIEVRRIAELQLDGQ